MLHSLCVSNYILIGSLETTFPEGLIIISGETGAGKSILLGALSLVLGAKADAQMVGPLGDNCVVEAEFGVNAAVRQLLRENDLPDEGDTLLIRRVVNRSGRSRSFICDEPVALPVLQELSAHLVDIHAQHQTLRLADEKFRMQALDLFASAGSLREACSAAWTRRQELTRQRDELRARLALARRDQAYNQSLWERLDQARLRAGELEELEAEQKELAHAEELKEMLCSAEALLEAEENAPTLQLKEAGKLLEKAGRIIPSLEPLAQRLESARLELEDIADELSRTNERLEASPERLAAVDERLSQLYSLLQKHGVQSIEALMAERDRLETAVSDASSLEEEVSAVEGELQAATLAYGQAAAALHEARAQSAGAFSSAIQEVIRSLELEQAVFQASLESATPGPNGTDRVQFLFSAQGKEPQDLAKSASGGELSRIMLSLKAIMARFTQMPTLVFDEIDTGVSGSAADKMGSLVCRMGTDMQVFAITHLPQVAAKGNAHYLVSKASGGTSIRRLDQEGREREIARMLSGSVITDAAMANARTLLQAH